MVMKKCLVWFRNDLRIRDNRALNAAINRGYEVIPVFIYVNGGRLGGASQWWLHHALEDLDQQIIANGGRLGFFSCEHGEESSTLLKLAKDFGAEAVFFNREYDALGDSVSKQCELLLQAKGIDVESFIGNVLHEPFAIKNKSGGPFQVFTPYWKNCREKPILDISTEQCVFYDGCKSSLALKINELKLLPKVPWDKYFYECWTPTRAWALERLQKLKEGKALEYGKLRDLPAEDGTSLFSAWLHFGQISVREIFSALSSLGDEVREGYIRQLYWRDFAQYLSYHFPHSNHTELRKEYNAFPWLFNEKFIEAWQKGRTGYPIVDAGMKQLWSTGWMHNRVRMIVASFLVKHLLQDWRVGLEWFEDTLLDADIANNAMGWQWCAGCGADAAPYFRVFNPVLQGEKFDKSGEYVKRYIPELKHIPDSHIHKPWELGDLELKSYGVTLGGNYPHPIIGLAEGRAKALSAYGEFKNRKS